MEEKLIKYNDYYNEKTSFQIKKIKTSEGELLLEGVFKIRWGICHPIRLKMRDEPKREKIKRSSSIPDNSHTESYNKDDNSTPSSKTLDVGDSVVMRSNRSKNLRKRLSIINGHLFSTETSIFIPSYGSVTSVNINSSCKTGEVIDILLDKFKVDNSASEFCLCAMKSNGEVNILGENDFPLIERIMGGPIEDNLSFYLFERYRVINISEEVAYFINLPDAMLQGFLIKYASDESFEKQFIKEKYRIYREKIEELIYEKYAVNV